MTARSKPLRSRSAAMASPRRCEVAMSRISGCVFASAAVLVALAVSPALAQTQRLRGTIEKVDGNTLSVKTGDGAAATLTLTGNATIVGVVKASLAEIKQG